MLEREGIQFLDHSEDLSKGIFQEKIRVRSEGKSILTVREILIEEKGFSRSRSFDEEDNSLCSFSVVYPFSERAIVEYWCPSYSPLENGYSDMLVVNVDQEFGAERLGQAWYDESGFLFEVYVYPLVSGYQKFDRALQEEEIDFDTEEGEERAARLMELTTSSSLKVLLLKGRKFFLKGVLKERTEETVDVGFADSGEMIFWDEYHYKMTKEGNKLIIEVFSGTKERTLKKRLAFPLEIKDYEQVLKLFIEDDTDWKTIPELIPVEVDFPASA